MAVRIGEAIVRHDVGTKRDAKTEALDATENFEPWRLHDEDRLCAEGFDD